MTLTAEKIHTAWIESLKEKTKEEAAESIIIMNYMAVFTKTENFEACEDFTKAWKFNKKKVDDGKMSFEVYSKKMASEIKKLDKRA